MRGPFLAGGAAAAGAIGGIVLGSRMLRQRTRKVLGIPIRRDGIGLKPLAKARAQAHKVGKALS